MQVLVIQNDALGPPALFGAWLEAQGAVLTIVTPDALRCRTRSMGST